MFQLGAWSLPAHFLVLGYLAHRHCPMVVIGVSDLYTFLEVKFMLDRFSKADVPSFDGSHLVHLFTYIQILDGFSRSITSLPSSKGTLSIFVSS